MCTHDACATGQLRLSVHGTIIAEVICQRCGAALRRVSEFPYAPNPRIAPPAARQGSRR